MVAQQGRDYVQQADRNLAPVAPNSGREARLGDSANEGPRKHSHALVLSAYYHHKEFPVRFRSS